MFDVICDAADKLENTHNAGKGGKGSGAMSDEGVYFLVRVLGTLCRGWQSQAGMGYGLMTCQIRISEMHAYMSLYGYKLLCIDDDQRTQKG